MEAQVLVASRYQKEKARKEVHPLAVAELGVETGDSLQQLEQLLVSDGLSIVFGLEERVLSERATHVLSDGVGTSVQLALVDVN